MKKITNVLFFDKSQVNRRDTKTLFVQQIYNGKCLASRRLTNVYFTKIIHIDPYLSSLEKNSENMSLSLFSNFLHSHLSAILTVNGRKSVRLPIFVLASWLLQFCVSACTKSAWYFTKPACIGVPIGLLISPSARIFALSGRYARVKKKGPCPCGIYVHRGVNVHSRAEYF